MRPLIFLIIIFISCAPYTTTYSGNDSIKHSNDEMELFKNEYSKYDLKDVDTILDVGSGTGYFDAELFRFYPKTFFILEDTYIGYKKENRSFILVNGKPVYFKNNSKFVGGKDDSIPLPSASYKLILCRKSVHEFKNPAKMVNELRRVLADDGILIIEDLIPKFSGEIDPYCKMRHLSKEELLSLFPKKDFKLISSDTKTYPIKKKEHYNCNIIKFKKNIS